MVGWVKNIMPYGVFVDFPYGLFGLAPKAVRLCFGRLDGILYEIVHFCVDLILFLVVGHG